jgi:glycogen synthase
MDYPFCYQYWSPSLIGSVETVVVSCESSPTLSPDLRLYDDRGMRVCIFLHAAAAFWKLDGQCGALSP